jgi:hypothetical protein
MIVPKPKTPGATTDPVDASPLQNLPSNPSAEVRPNAGGTSLGLPQVPKVRLRILQDQNYGAD